MKYKNFAGARLKRLREEHALTQAEMAGMLQVSPAYLNQMEHDKRPVSERVLLALAERFALDPRLISEAKEDRIAADLEEVLRDPVFQGKAQGLRAVKRDVEAAPDLAARTLTLYGAYQQLLDDYRQLADRVAGDETLRDLEGVQYPYEEVRDFVYFRNNHLAELDDAAEDLAAREDFRVGDMFDDLSTYLARRHGIRVVIAEEGAESRPLRQFQEERRTLVLSPRILVNRRAFHLAYQLGLKEFGPLMDQIIAGARLSSPASEAVARVGLANYFAGALLMPYGRFRDTAEVLRYDLEALEVRFGVSFEQICHRISTLQRPGQEGVPFYFLRVDIAGNISKRHSATPFTFARAGGACPLWNVHAAFAQPGRILVQLARTPDERTYLCIARTVTKGGGGYMEPRRQFALGLGCEVKYAHRLVYSAGMDLTDLSAAVPIGASCRVCERANCAQRAFPPINRRLVVDEGRKRFAPYEFEAG